MATSLAPINAPTPATVHPIRNLILPHQEFFCIS